jgi:Ca-activated chloride channel family protein
MGTLNAVLELVARTLSEWRSGSIGDLGFNSTDAALLAAALLAVTAAVAFAWRTLRGRLPGRTSIALPAMLPRLHHGSSLAFVRHTPFLLFLAGLPFLCLALADPHSQLSAQQTSYPGRRIAVIMDASLSMLSPFLGKELKTQSDTAFSNTMAAAEHFIRMRMKGNYRDLIALEQFGNEAYVITPFTTDYENLLLSLKMISNVEEWQRFPDQGTIIMKAIDEGVDLFNAFDFLDSSGNIMVIFSDGQDNNVQIGNMSLEQVLKKAVDNKVPVYMIRTAFSRNLGDVVPDQVWKKAIDATGGRFYPAANQQTIMQAIREIDAAATGRVEVREYAVKQPRYAKFALAAVLLWTLALGLQMTFGTFRTFP